MLQRYPRFAELIDAGPDTVLLERLGRAKASAGPSATRSFIAGLEAAAQRPLKPKKRGPKPAPADAGTQPHFWTVTVITPKLLTCATYGRMFGWSGKSSPCLSGRGGGRRSRPCLRIDWIEP